MLVFGDVESEVDPFAAGALCELDLFKDGVGAQREFCVIRIEVGIDGGDGVGA